MLSRLGQVNHYYVDAYYAKRLCGFPQYLSDCDWERAPIDYLSAKLCFSIERMRSFAYANEMLLQNSRGPIRLSQSVDSTLEV